jgi:hypothetical protein
MELTDRIAGASGLVARHISFSFRLVLPVGELVTALGGFFGEAVKCGV